MQDLLAAALAAIAWPREMLARFEIDPGLESMHADVDLPEVEMLPVRHAAIAGRGLKLNIRDRSEAELRRAYVTHVHGVVFRVVGEAFATLPSLRSIVCSGFSQRIDPATGTSRDDYLVSVKVGRDAWSTIDFTKLSQVDPVAALGRFDLRSDHDAAGRICPIVPFED